MRRCVLLKSCEPMLRLIQENKHRLTDANVRNSMRKYTCGFDYAENSAVVCCPSGPLTLEVKTTPPIVSQHPNWSLLPTGCGDPGILSKITQGQHADLMEFPWLVALKYNGRCHYCDIQLCCRTVLACSLQHYISIWLLLII